MLDGRVLEASQVECEPFGKTPVKREPPGFLAIRLISSTQVPTQLPLVFTFLPRQAAIRA